LGRSNYLPKIHSINNNFIINRPHVRFKYCHLKPNHLSIRNYTSSAIVPKIVFDNADTSALRADILKLTKNKAGLYRWGKFDK